MSKKERSKSSKSKEIVDVVTLSENPDTEGFDIQAGETWIYPTNYSLREYQYNIIQEALLSNTMVSLPTGLGKTFIAAVVMYNFYRWYPTGKVIFMAPTRPLVKQQIDACYNIMAIPKDVTAELTGTKAQAARKEVWKEKRVFFITPQVLQNDLCILTELGTRIKCIVFDEAHKAKGNYAYCEIIKKLLPQNKHFRVLALSATPGSSLNDVLEVTRNLLISRLEIRTDESPDVTPYIFQRSLETVVVPLGEKLQQVRDDYLQILEKYTRVLVQHRVITGNCSTLTKGKIFMTMKDYQEKSRNNRDAAYSDIMRNLNICVTLYHAYELLIRHGLRGFLSFFEEHAEKPILRGNVELPHIMQDVRAYLGPAPNIEPLPDGSILAIPESTKFGHPKFYKLSEILLSHFNNGSNATTSRVIVFCEYRESVMEAYASLLRHQPLIRPRIFLGQGAITQRQQISVIKVFKEGQCNTLISTSIGEEGLDVGEVDLIVCFDINNKSPVRMVQRMGRTGRKREGRVVVLVTEGKEQQTLKDCLIHKQNLTNHILQSSALYKEMYAQNPRMVPVDITPKCQKLHITVTVDSKAQASKKKGNNLKDMFNHISDKKNSVLFPQNYDMEVLKISDRIPVKQEYWNKGNPLSINCDKSKIDFSKKLGKLRAPQPTGKIGHTKNSELLVSLLQFAESKKYNIPMTQLPVMLSQITQPTTSGKVLSSNSLKQADIRNMFSKPPSSTDLASSDNKDIKIIQEETNFSKNTLNMLYTEISSYLTITISDQTNCKICDNLFDCSQFTMTTKEFNIKTWVEPDFSVFNSLTAENLTTFLASLNPKSNLTKNINMDSKTDIKTIINSNNNLENNFNNINFEDSFKPSPFKPPKNIRNILQKSETPLTLDDSVFNNISFTQMEHASTLKPVAKTSDSKLNETILCSLDVNAFEEADFTQIKTRTFNESSNSKCNDTLTFFNMTALEELFIDPLPLSTPRCEKNLSYSQDTIIYTPDDCINSPVKKSSGSPVLCSNERVRHLKNRAQKRLFENSKQDTIQNYGKRKCIEANKNMSMDIFSDLEITITEKVEPAKALKPVDTKSRSPFKSNMGHDQLTLNKISNVNEENVSDLDIIDTSLENCLESIVTTQVVRKENKPEISVGDIIDLSIFGLDMTTHSDKINKKINCNIISDNDVNKNNIDATKFQISRNEENTAELKKSAKECVSVLKDFCDDTFIDMFLENDLFEEGKTERNNTTHKSEDVNITLNKNLGTSANNKKSEEKNEWKEESIWNFCMNSFPNEDNANNKEDHTKEDNSMFNSAISKQEKDENKNFNEKLTSQIESIKKLNENNNCTAKKNEQSSNKQEKGSEVVDLTEDCPIKDPTSPILVKSARRTPLKSLQTKKLSNPKNQQNTKNNNFKSTKRKLQLNSKNAKSSITSMDWFKKTNTSQPCSTKTAVTTTKTITSQTIPASNPFEDDCDMNDSFNFTFNQKKPLVRKQVSQSKISPVVDNTSKIATESRTFDTTPKKLNPKENERSLNTPHRRKNLNELIQSVDDSDDDFELPRKTTGWIKTKRKNLLECSKLPLTKTKNLISSGKNGDSTSRRKNNIKKLEQCAYIELEAEMSMDEHASSDTDCEETDGDDKFEESFVDDETQNIANNTVIHAHYMQSVRSPLLNRGKFKIPKIPPPLMNVYSQQVDQAENTYINDSFCVNTEEMDLSQETKTHDLSELEMAELILKQQRIEKRRRKKSGDKPSKKRCRILECSSDSD